MRQLGTRNNSGCCRQHGFLIRRPHHVDEDRMRWTDANSLRISYGQEGFEWPTLCDRPH